MSRLPELLTRTVGKNMPTARVDLVQLHAMKRVPVVMLRFFTVTTAGPIEACRLQTSASHRKEMLDVISRSIAYYPTQPARVQTAADSGAPRKEPS